MRASISKTLVAIVTVMHYMSACKYVCHNKPTTSTTSPSAHKETSVISAVTTISRPAFTDQQQKIINCIKVGGLNSKV